MAPLEIEDFGSLFCWLRGAALLRLHQAKTLVRGLKDRATPGMSQVEHQ
jgi:hypothetical protein